MLAEFRDVNLYLNDVAAPLAAYSQMASAALDIGAQYIAHLVLATPNTVLKAMYDEVKARDVFAEELV